MSGSRSGRHPEENARFVWDGSELVGFVWLSVRPGEREAHKLGQWGGVRPSRRRQGIGTQLFDWAVAPRRRDRAHPDAALPTKLETDAAQHQGGRQGRAPPRPATSPCACSWRSPGTRARPSPSSPRPPGWSWCPGARSSTRARASPTRSRFADHWGSEPRTREEWEQWYTGHRAFRPDLSVLAGRAGQRGGRHAGAHLLLPAGLGHGPGRGVDQHGGHPSRVARQGRGELVDGRSRSDASRRALTTASSGRSSGSTPRTPPAR